MLCVTHLPQVAAQGHSQLRVRKASAKSATTTIVEALDDPARIAEIARMLGGVSVTEESLAHARQMLGDAQSSP